MTAHVLQFTEPSRTRYELRSWGEFALFDRSRQEECTPRGRKACGILAFLASLGSERVNRERLTALLWSERGDEQARASLRQALLELKQLGNGEGSLLTIERGFVRLNPLLLTSDSARFQSEAELGNIEGLCAALRDRNGEMFTGLDGLDPAFDEWLALQRRLEHERLLAAGVKAAAIGLDEGKPGPVRDLAASLQALDQTNEDVARVGMLADHASGNLPAMHRRYQQLCDELSRELNVAPSAETQALFNRLANGSLGVKATVQSVQPGPAPLTDDAEQVAEPTSTVLAQRSDPQAHADVPFWQRKWTRRAAGGGILAAGAGAMFAFAFRERLELQFSDMSAAELTRRGQDIQKSGGLGTVRRAMDFYKRATTIDPNYAPAWAALALSYRHPAQGPANFTESPRAIPQLIRSAAQRAVKLDPGNLEARLALAAIYPAFRRWREQEDAFRKLQRQHPNSALTNSFLGLLLVQVGRFEEALPYLRRVVALDPMLAFAWGTLAHMLYVAGRDREAQLVLDEAFARFPKHLFLWNVRWFTLIGAKRYAEAAAYMRDPATLPDVMGKQGVEKMAGVADALAAGRAGDGTVKDLFCASCNNIESTPPVAPLIAACGAMNATFDLLEAFFLGGAVDGYRYEPPGMAEERWTFMLFDPNVLALRGDPRFARLLERIGLEDYWRQSGTRPDFRRNSKA